MRKLRTGIGEMQEKATIDSVEGNLLDFRETRW